jgi:catechol 2,3-dioxygenase-like lactoylglutathione lyase family enzyme
MNIVELELLTNNIDKTAAFYSDVIGLLIISRAEFSIMFAAGSTKLIFRQSNIQAPVYHFAFDIPNNKLNEAFAWIERKIAIIEVVPPEKIADFINWNAKSFYFYDNNGNILECITRYNLGIASDKSFDGSSIISISEIGLVSRDIVLLSVEIYSRFGVSVFPMQPKLDKFIVLGTETGLFILSEEGRNWYPTQIIAKPFWKKVTFRNKDKMYVFETNN